MLRIFLTASLAAGLAAAAGAAPQVLIDTDFGTADQAVNNVSPDGLKSITGVVPQGWRDDNGWKKEVVIEYRVVEEMGRKFLRVTQTRGGGVQLAYHLPGIEKEEGFYRLTFTARSPMGTGGSVGIRFVGAPYTTVWQTTPGISPELRDFSFDFRLAKQPQAIGLWFWPNEGVLDLHKLRLVKMDQADLIAEMKVRYPVPAGKNRVRVSRFPLGLESGWFLDRDNSDGDEVTAAPDKGAAGPSGAPALSVAGRNAWKVTTAPFLIPPWNAQPHTMSIAVKGNAQGKMVAIADGRHVGEQAFTAGEVWGRVSVTFTPQIFAKAHAVRIEGQGTLWMDALQVEEGKDATAYASPAPAEVALALPASDAAAARVQFADEPAVIQCCVTGEVAGAVLKAKVVSVYGDEKPLPDTKMGAGFLHEGRLRYDVLAGRPLGAFRVEAWVEDAAGKRLSPESEVVVHRVRRPRYWGKDAPASPFGVHTNSTTRHNIMAKAIGCNWVRLHDAGTPYIGWAFLESEKGKWEFADEPIQRYRKHGLKILGLVSTAPGWATDWGQPAKGYFERYFQPKSMDDWAAYVRTVVKRYQGVIDTYEVWNEPWGSSFWIGSYDRVNTQKPFMERLVRSKTADADFALLQKTAYEAAKATDPKVRILGFNSLPGDWTQKILDQGGMETCDVVSYHNYVSGQVGAPKDDPEHGFRACLDPISTKLGNLPKPIWMSEGNVLGSELASGFYRVTVPYAPPTGVVAAADRLARYVLSHRVLGEEKTFLYTMHGHGYFGGRHEWTCLVGGDGYLHPSGAAHSALAWLVEDTRYVKMVEPARGVYAYLFEGKGRAVAVLSSRPTHAPYVVPAGAGLEALDLFGNPLAKGSPLGAELAYLTGKSLAAVEKAVGGK